MGYIVINCEQGSPEWHQARAGVITASMFSTARERMKVNRGEKKAGDLSDKALNYAFRVAFERISRKPLDEGFETWQMARGHELEPDARREHEILIGLDVVHAGFIKTEDSWFGASADGLIGDMRGSEYKCLVSPERLRAVLIDNDTSDFKDQVQGCMWISGRSDWDLCFYCPQLEEVGYPLHMVKMKRDDDYIELMERDLLQFKAHVERTEQKLRDLAEERRLALGGAL